MRSSVLMFVLFVAMIGACVGCAAGRVRVVATPIVRTVDVQAALAVSVVTLCHDRSRTGSGVVIDRHRVLTAAHVAGCIDGLALVGLRTGVGYEMRVERIDVRADVAVLYTGRDLGIVPAVDVAPVRVGMAVCFEASVPERVRSCGAVRPNPYPDHALSTNTNAVIEGGNSGSGVYDARGRLVGVVTHGRVLDRSGGLFTSLAPRPWLVTP